MGRKSEIRGRINHLRGMIHEYEGNINDLTIQKSNLDNEYSEINVYSEIPIKNYDISRLHTWTGNTYSKAESFREDAVLISEKEQCQFRSLLSDIDTAIQRLREMINSCRAEISNLESILASIED